MANEMDGLAERVRLAFNRAYVVMPSRNRYADMDIVRAELLRLAQREKELERENGELRAMVAEWRTKDATHEAELAAIRKRIAEAPTCNVMLRSCDPPIHAHDVVCYDEKFMDKWMRVALLPLDDEAKS